MFIRCVLMHRSLIINASQDHCSQTSGPGPQIHAHLILFATVAHVMAPWFQVCWIRWSSPSQCRTIRTLPPISNQSMFLPLGELLHQCVAAGCVRWSSHILPISYSVSNSVSFLLSAISTCFLVSACHTFCSSVKPVDYCIPDGFRGSAGH